MSVVSSVACVEAARPGAAVMSLEERQEREKGGQGAVMMVSFQEPSP